MTQSLTKIMREAQAVLEAHRRAATRPGRNWDDVPDATLLQMVGPEAFRQYSVWADGGPLPTLAEALELVVINIAMQARI